MIFAPGPERRQAVADGHLSAEAHSLAHIRYHVGQLEPTKGRIDTRWLMYPEEQYDPSAPGIWVGSAQDLGRGRPTSILVVSTVQDANIMIAMIVAMKDRLGKGG